jgi:hypothetical protein
MTMTLVLRSRMRRKSHVRFWSGGEGSDPLTAHNLGVAAGLITDRVETL